jgi:hypothetical protein
MLYTIAAPMQAFALTGGPSQPEVQSFEPVSANQMVDPFTGDFTYNIPLLDVGGYPINISYHAGPGLDAEASWVGLGWNINPGVINRSMRGIPDDFFSPDPTPTHPTNDYIKRINKMNPVRNYSIGFSPKNEFFSQDAGNFLTVGVDYNNYRGLGFNFDLQQKGWPFSINFSSQNGFGVNVNYSKVLDNKIRQDVRYGENNGSIDWDNVSLIGSVNLGINSRSGITDITFNTTKTKETISRKKHYTFKGGKVGFDLGAESSINSASFNSSSSISFLSSSYIPAVSDRNYSLSLNFSTELGFEFLGFNPDSRISIGYSQTGVMKKDRTRVFPTYGFMYQAQAYNNFEHPDVKRDIRGRAIMDFNTYGRSSLSKAEVQLPYTVSTFDILSVSGQGIGGMYRAHSASVGTVYDQSTENRSIPPLSVGLDLGATQTAKIGIDVASSYFKSKSGRWKDNNDLFEHMNFANTRSGADFEQVYFKNVGEKTTVDKNFYDVIDGGIAARPEMDASLISKNANNNSAVGITLKNQLKTWVNDPVINSKVIRQKRDKRNQIITSLTAKEAEDFGLIKYRSSHAKDHHIGEITAINPGGSRYVYAQPAYNTVQKSYTFSFDKTVGGRTVDDATNIAWFASGDETDANSLTLEKFFDYEEIPPYAHSYLLNAVLSPDYVDITGDGPSPDDNGSYTHIEYNKLPSIYKWRTPYADGSERVPPISNKFSANYQQGLESDKEDDKASFVYGEKEIFYTSKIETKTHIAIFHTSPTRTDGLGVKNIQGEKEPGVKLHQLDSIQLFTTYDYYNYPNSRKPLKVVYFTYDQSLCPGIPNSSNSAGKLTLKTISFKYGDSRAGTLSPYQFQYSNNYSYGYKNYDRWGNYKAAQSEPSNHEFPYCEQDKTLADQYAAAWSLSQIILPSGGKINIEYEADDYAYVQDKAAMEMFKIWGFNYNTNVTIGNSLYANNGFRQHEYAIFKYKPGYTNAQDYLPDPSPIDGKRYLYINAHVKLKTDLSNQSYYEYVRCYAEIESAGTCTDDPTAGYFKIKLVPLNEAIGVSYGNVNPVAKNAWQFLRLNTPHLVYEGQNVLRGKGHDGVNISDVANMAFAVFGYLPELARTLIGYNTYQMLAGNGNEFNVDVYGANESYMRLKNPSGKKIGGGLRVKKVLIDNDWATIASGEESQTLGQIYDYTMEENGRTISSGVASYEPQIGGDENPHRLPSFYSTKKLGSLGQEDYFFNDIPLGESLYPAPSVGYRQVKVRNIKPDEDNDINTTGTITRHGTGYTIQKFYTAYDFPTITSKTTVSADFKRSPVLSLLKLSQEIVGATQGFAIELNDMHGKPKAQEVYDEYGKLITKTEYKYKTDPNNNKRLSNTVTALRSDGTIDREALVGYEIEMLMHPRQLIEWGISGRINTDLDVFFVGIAPVLTPGFGINLSGSYKMVRTATATKVINRFGILESVTVTDQSSSVSTINKAFDEETGEALLTETTNEFNDRVFNFTYPAHWAYDEGMGSAYKNTGVSFSGVTTASGIANFSTADAQFIVEGDEFIADDGTSEIQVWVLDKFDNGGAGGIDYKITFIDRNGSPIVNGTYLLKNIRSGRRNMQTVPVGSIVGNTNPIPDVGSSFFTNGEVVMDAINASAATFSDRWQAYRHDPGCWSKDCEAPYAVTRDFGGQTLNNYCLYSALQNPPINFPKFSEIVNPYVLGIRGNWRPDYTYVYYDRGLTTHQRNQANAGTSAFNGTNIAVDGRINTFKPFWFVNSGNWDNRGVNYQATPNPWTWNSVANQINPDGIELENKNALNIFSSAIYSFVSKQPLAVTYNAELRETLFEGFEDYPVTNDINIFTCQSSGGLDPVEYTLISPQFGSPPFNSSNETEKTKLITTPFHWYLWPTINFDGSHAAQIKDDIAHTGKKALCLYNTHIKVPTQVYDKNNNPFNGGSQPINEYQVNNEDLTDIFAPKLIDAQNPSKTQILTYWVNVLNSSLSSASVSIEYQGTPVPLTLISESKPIEGWVKREYSFAFSSMNANDIVDVIISNTSASYIYFDDIRIHPIDANMKSFVYDNNTLRLSATLDENNYATFFEYDEEGNLVRTKRETERGIITINENRQNIRH